MEVLLRWWQRLVSGDPLEPPTGDELDDEDDDWDDPLNSECESEAE